MPRGPGKYDDLATYVIEQTDALGVIVLVFGGNRGNGFSVQATKEVAEKLPVMLRTMADIIERDGLDHAVGI